MLRGGESEGLKDEETRGCMLSHTSPTYFTELTGWAGCKQAVNYPKAGTCSQGGMQPPYLPPPFLTCVLQPWRIPINPNKTSTNQSA